MYQYTTLIPLFAAVISAQQTAWGQCGGGTWNGATTCASGYSCVIVNPSYSQCQPSSSSTTTLQTSTTTTTTTVSAPTGTSGGNGKLKWVGVDESCAEWGTNMPGTLGKDYTFASTDTIGTLMGEGYNIFRVPFAMERMAQGSLTANLDYTYLSGYSEAINYITKGGAHAVVDPHNYGRYNGQVITDTDAFGSFWTKLATVFKDNTNVIFDINNEFNQMDQSLVFELNQAGIDAIRGAGATSQYIFAEGNFWTGAATWNTTNDNLKDLKDPSDKLIYEMHEYLDSDGSGTSGTCVSQTIGVERIVGATKWLKDNGKLGVLGEFAGGANDVCKAALTGLLDHLQDNSDVWTGAVWWSAGPWWPAGQYGDFEPGKGAAYAYYDTLLSSYL